MICWLLTQFSQRRLRIFVIFCMKLEDYKGRKKAEPDFWKKSPWFADIRKKISKLAQNQTLLFFSKTALTIILVFGLKLVLNMTFDLNETYFSEKNCNLEIFDLEIVKTLPKLKFLAILFTLHNYFSLILHITIGGHDV